MKSSELAERVLAQSTIRLETIEGALYEAAKTPILPADFFSDLSNSRYASRSNIPSGMSVPHFLMFGGPGILDVKPMPAHQFERIYGVDIRAAARLCEAGLLLPSLYARQPKAWVDCEHMAPLLEQTSLVMGDRISGYMKIGFPQYEKLAEQREATLRRVRNMLRAAEKRVFGEEARVMPSASLPKAIARRWTYLDAFDPRAAGLANELLDRGQFDEFLLFVEAAKNFACAPITSAAGGHFVWGQQETRWADVGGAPAPESRDDNDQYLKIDPARQEALEYILTVIAKMPPFEVVGAHQAHLLIDFVSDRENMLAKTEMLRLLDDLVALAIRGGNPDPKVDDFRRVVAIYRKRVDHFAKALFASSGGLISAAVGVFAFGTGGGTLAALGGMSANVLDNVFSLSSEKGAAPTMRAAARKMALWNNERADRVLLALERLPRASDEHGA